jgi:formate dehydrogenase gamma subunit
MEKILESEGKVLRHDRTVRITHWLIALSCFVLVFSGFGQMPIYKRYMITEFPGLTWTADYFITLKMHYIAALVLTLAGVWHVVYHYIRKDFGLLPRKGDMGESIAIIKAMFTGGKEPPSDKYLAEQRLAYAFIAGVVALLILTGIVKTVKSMGISLPEGLVFWSTQMHNLGAVLIVLGIFAHLAAFVVPANRNLFGSMFHGKVNLDYAKHRHSIWFEKLSKKIGKHGG